MASTENPNDGGPGVVQPEPPTAAYPSSPAPAAAADLRRLLSPWRTWGRWVAAIASGLALSAAFPPLEYAGLAWIALLPLLLAPPPPTLGGRALLGWVFGLAHFGTCLAWLNEIGFAAGVLLALVCALYPMAWYLTATAVLRRMGGREPAQPQDVAPRCLPRWPWHQCLAVLLLPAVWVGLEWVRSWLCTGFPWDQLGVSQWRKPPLLVLSTVGGVYGVSFAVAAVNVALCFSAAAWWEQLRYGARRRFPAALGLVVLGMAAVTLLTLRQPPVVQPDDLLRVLAVQGNIPQCRKWTQEQLDESIQVYTSLSRDMARSSELDLIVWPETAVPAPLRYDKQYNRSIEELLRDVKARMLVGTIDYRQPAPTAASPAKDSPGAPADYQVFNSVFLLAPDGRIEESYDKIHIVPFGEYTPFERLFPWLTDIIGMGRSLTAGREFTLFELPHGARAGVNICYEDAFPEISRQFVLRGANVLMTLTNDAWYAESAGSRQHLIHAVFRAAENRRPLLRSGNNSDTCLILPSGRIVGLLYDSDTGSRFVRAARCYDVPVWEKQGYTFYTLHGDVFAKVCALVALLTWVGLAQRRFREKQRLLQKITGTDGTAAAAPPDRSV